MEVRCSHTEAEDPDCSTEKEYVREVAVRNFDVEKDCRVHSETRTWNCVEREAHYYGERGAH